NLLLTGIVLNPAVPTCSATFNVILNVTNTGNGPSTATSILVQDVHMASGTINTSGTGFVPPLNPGASITVSIPLNVTVFYNEAHQILANLGNSQITTSYILTQGPCNNPPTVPPTATHIPIPPTRTPIPRTANLLLNGIALNPPTPSCG